MLRRSMATVTPSVNSIVNVVGAAQWSGLSARGVRVAMTLDAATSKVTE